MPTDTMTDNKTRTKIKPKMDLQPPPLYQVLYLNDSTTSMEFVIESLIVIFDHSKEDAHALTMKVHEEGSAVVAVLPYELAEQKGVEATVLARNNGYPLMVRLEPEA
jgi:ATP-dependent Clp protease adaptor protein ClpS